MKAWVEENDLLRTPPIGGVVWGSVGPPLVAGCLSTTVPTKNLLACSQLLCCTPCNLSVSLDLGSGLLLFELLCYLSLASPLRLGFVVLFIDTAPGPHIRGIQS